jgi:hypothetical protein
MPSRWTRWTRDQSPLADLDLTPAEYAALRAWMGAATPEKIDALWTYIGTNADTGASIPTGAAGAAFAALHQDRLLEVLLARAEAECNEERGPQSWDPVRRSVRRYWLEGLAIAAAVLLIAAVIRIAGARAGWWEAGLTPQVVAARALGPDSTITADDLAIAWLPPQPGAAADIAEVAGRRLAHAVQSGRTFDRDGLLALQVVARVPLSAGSRIRLEDVRLDWSPEKHDAFTDRHAMAGLCASDPIRQDAAITRGDVSKCP